MPSIYYEIFQFIEEISEQINTLYNINPKVYIIFSQKNDAIEGECQSAYRIDLIYLSIIIPNNYVTFGKKHKTEVLSTLIHEYSHYITDIQLTVKERMKLDREYENSLFVRRCVEQSNWTMTKHLAQQLGLWNKYFYNVCKESCYTSNLKYTRAAKVK